MPAKTQAPLNLLPTLKNPRNYIGKQVGIPGSFWKGSAARLVVEGRVRRSSETARGYERSVTAQSGAPPPHCSAPVSVWFCYDFGLKWRL